MRYFCVENLTAAIALAAYRAGVILAFIALGIAFSPLFILLIAIITTAFVALPICETTVPPDENIRRTT